MSPELHNDERDASNVPKSIPERVPRDRYQSHLGEKKISSNGTAGIASVQAIGVGITRRYADCFADSNCLFELAIVPRSKTVRNAAIPSFSRHHAIFLRPIHISSSPRSTRKIISRSQPSRKSVGWINIKKKEKRMENRKTYALQDCLHARKPRYSLSKHVSRFGRLAEDTNLFAESEPLLGWNFQILEIWISRFHFVLGHCYSGYVDSVELSFWQTKQLEIENRHSHKNLLIYFIALTHSFTRK